MITETTVVTTTWREDIRVYKVSEKCLDNSRGCWLSALGKWQVFRGYVDIPDATVSTLAQCAIGEEGERGVKFINLIGLI